MDSLTFVIYGGDNESYAFRAAPQLTANQQVHQHLIPDMSGESAAGVRRCEACGGLLAKWEEPLAGLKIKKRRFDISSTYDGVDVASQQFKDVVESNGLTGLAFTPLPDDNAFYSVRATHTVQVDPEKSMTRFVNKCPSCGIYESIVGPYTVLKEGESVPQRGFAKTDIEFASEDEKHPQLLCDQEAANVLAAANLKGLELIPPDAP